MEHQYVNVESLSPRLQELYAKKQELRLRIASVALALTDITKDHVDLINESIMLNDQIRFEERG